MRIKVQFCWHGGDKYTFRALVAGGIHIPTESQEWTRKHATAMLNRLEVEIPAVPRSAIRFDHV